METPSRITLRDIAKYLNVSHVTVSLALRDHPRISLAVRKMVKERAEVVGYRPLLRQEVIVYAETPKQKRADHATIGWINAWPLPSKLRSLKEFNNYWTGASVCAAKNGYELEEICLASYDPKEFASLVKSRKIQGFLFPPTPPAAHDLLRSYNWSQYACVRLGRITSWPLSHIVSCDQFGSAMLGYYRAVERGYQRIGFVGDDSHYRLFASGFLLAQRISGRKGMPQLPISDKNGPSLPMTVLAWLKEHRPDAIVTDIPNLPFIVKHLGYRIPEDVAMAGLSLLDIELTANLVQNSEEVGRVGLLTLLDLIKANIIGPPQIIRETLITGSWVDGPSMPDLNFSKHRSYSHQE